MSIDLIHEEIFSASRRRRISFPPPATWYKKTHISTLLRMGNERREGPDGTIVRLEALRLGGRWVTSREAIQRFMERLTPRVDVEAQPAPRSPGQRASERAAEELRRRGV